MASGQLSGRLERELELKCSADEFYKVFRQNTHHIPNHAPKNIQKVYVHEGDWETSGSVRVWHYTTLDGKEEIFKERVELDDEKKTITLHGVDGHAMDNFNVFRPFWELTPKESGCKVKCNIYYERKTEADPIPNHYMDFMVDLTQTIDAGLAKA